MRCASGAAAGPGILAETCTAFGCLVERSLYGTKAHRQRATDFEVRPGSLPAAPQGGLIRPARGVGLPIFDSIVCSRALCRYRSRRPQPSLPGRGPHSASVGFDLIRGTKVLTLRNPSTAFFLAHSTGAPRCRGCARPAARRRAPGHFGPEPVLTALGVTLVVAVAWGVIPQQDSPLGRVCLGKIGQVLLCDQSDSVVVASNPAVPTLSNVFLQVRPHFPVWHAGSVAVQTTSWRKPSCSVSHCWYWLSPRFMPRPGMAAPPVSGRIGYAYCMYCELNGRNGSGPKPWVSEALERRHKGAPAPTHGPANRHKSHRAVASPVHVSLSSLIPRPWRTPHHLTGIIVTPIVVRYLVIPVGSRFASEDHSNATDDPSFAG